MTRFLYRKFIASLFMLSPEQGADTLVWLASSNDWTPGEYYVKRSPARKSAAARDPELARKLWAMRVCSLSRCRCRRRSSSHSFSRCRP